MAWAQAAAAALPIIAGAIGGKKAGKADKEAQRILDRAAEAAYGLEVPDLESLQYDPTLSEYAGDINPALLANMADIGTSYDNISTDPRFVQAQYQSLGGLDELIAGGGMTAADKLAYQNATDGAAMQASREQGNIARDMAERGLSGGGNELAMRLASSQGAANRGAEAAQTQAATAQQRALDALLQRGEMGSQMQQADFNRQSEAAQARDRIAQFNRNNAMDVQTRNVNASNNAMTGNRDLRQNTANINADISNVGKQRNVGAVQDTFNNNVTKVTGGSLAAESQAANRTAGAARTRNMYSGIAKDIPGAIGAGSNIYKGASVGQGNYDAMSGEEQDALPWYKKSGIKE